MDHEAPVGRSMTLLDLAQDLGVSRATVSNAYNRPDQLSEALRIRILSRAAEVGFPGPNPLARGLRRHRVGAVGVLLGESLSYAFGDPAAVVILDGVAQALEADRLALLLVADSPLLPASGQPAPEGAGRIGADPRKVTDAAVDAWVVYAMEDGHPFILAALARREPIVVVDQPALVGVPRVEVDDVNGTAAAATHLFGLGHRDVVVLSLPFDRDGRSGPVDEPRIEGATFRVTLRRLAGARAAAADVDGVRLRVIESAHNHPDWGAAVLAPLLDGPATDRPTAVLAMSDQLALGAMWAAHRAGLGVPDDLSVVGFDDIAAAATAGPPLTTVRQPLLARGRQAGDLVSALLRDEPVEEVTSCPCELIIRATTARPANR